MVRTLGGTVGNISQIVPGEAVLPAGRACHRVPARHRERGVRREGRPWRRGISHCWPTRTGSSDSTRTPKTSWGWMLTPPVRLLDGCSVSEAEEAVLAEMTRHAP